MSQKFKKTVENFTCGHCQAHVLGNGYTNHCPICLWSKHVDVNPGDRLETCGGLMEPVFVETKGSIYKISHKCQKCGIIKNNISSPEDNFEELVKLAAKNLPL